MLHLLTGTSFVLLLAVTVFAGDSAIGAAIAHDTPRALVYGILAILALIATVAVAFGL
jgi:hypothetical protein